jgi:rhamnosyltransferase
VTMKRPSISVLIPTYNAGERFARSLGSILEQQVDAVFEVVVADSGSSDCTLAVCAGLPARVLHVPAGSFQHGQTRNWAIARLSSDYVVLTVQDASPAGVNWLSWLVHPLLQDGTVAGSYGRQLPWPEHDKLVHTRHAVWYGDDEPLLQSLSGCDADAIGLAEKQRLARFDNVTSCIRREVWEDIPFPAVRFGEDFAWAWEALKRGYSVAYEPRAQVWHSHQRGLWNEFQRYYLMGEALHRVFGGVFSDQPPVRGVSLSEGFRWLVDSMASARKAITGVSGGWISREQVWGFVAEAARSKYLASRSTLEALFGAGSGFGVLPLDDWLDSLWQATNSIPAGRTTSEALRHAVRRFLRKLDRLRRGPSQGGLVRPYLGARVEKDPGASMGRLLLGYLGLILIRAGGRDVVARWVFDELVELDWDELERGVLRLPVGRLWRARGMVYEVLSGFLLGDSAGRWSKRYVWRVWLYGILRAGGLCLGEQCCWPAGPLRRWFRKLVDRWLSAGVV